MPPDYYRQHGISPADVPALMRMYHDPEIIYMENNGSHAPSWYARFHVLRALVELRAPGILPILLDNLRAESTPDGSIPVIEDCTELIPKFGDEACATLITDLQANNGQNNDLALSLAETLGYLGEQHPHLRDTCRDAICRQLENHPVNDCDYNAFLISALIDLKAVEAAPLIEQAYAANKVALSLNGDWESAQINLGLKTRRDTPESVEREAIREEFFQNFLSSRSDNPKPPYDNPDHDDDLGDDLDDDENFNDDDDDSEFSDDNDFDDDEYEPLL